MALSLNELHQIKPMKSTRKNSAARTRAGGWKKVFLNALADTGMVGKAAETASVNRRTAYMHRSKDEKFKRAWKRALRLGESLLKDEAVRRAVHGTLKPVYHQGQACGAIREYSDTLLIFLMKAANPRKYRERFTVDVNARSSVEKKIKELGITKEQIDADPGLAQILTALGIGVVGAATGGSATGAAEC